MSELYMENGEKFVVTTHRISVSLTLYNIMLTTRSLILIDSSLVTFSPRKIPLGTILSVNAGKIPTGEPVIILTFIDKPGEDVQPPMNLIFTQSGGERRRSERDSWIRNLMEQIVDLRQESLQREIPVPLIESGKSLRTSPPLRGIDIPPPHKTVIHDEHEVITFDVIPETISQGQKDSVSIQDRAETEKKEETPIPVRAEVHEKRETETAEIPEDGGVTGMELPEQKDSTLFSDMEHELPEEQVTVAVEITGGGVVTGEIFRAPGEHDEEPEPVKSPPEYAIPALQPDQQFPAGGLVQDLQPDNALGSWPDIPPEVLEEIARKTGEPFQGMPSAPAIPVSGEKNLPEIPFGILDEITLDSGEPFQEPSPQHSAEPVFSEEHPPEKPSRKSFSIRRLAAALIIVIVLALAGSILYSFTAVPGESPVVPVTPNDTPESVIPTPVSTQTRGGVPSEGVWLLVSYNGSYIGYYGKPGNLNHVGGSGQLLYPVFGEPSLLQASFQKQDYSGSTLTLDVYNNGTRVFSRNTRIPMGSIEFIIDPATGEYPGGTPTPASWTGLDRNQTYLT